ncbi:MAG TPA: FKBP-type peptidyl-prolyl cis-trans isomerase [Segetibacter sp.]|jgi:FKBP-type peptidyl-prolyl cis-trans isomerase SlyD
MIVADNTVVSIRYKMLNSKGEVLEDNLNNKPVQYLHGAGNLMSALEADLEGLKTGENKKIVIARTANNADIDDDFTCEVFVDEIRHATHEEIKKGSPQKPDQIENCGPNCCC